VNIQVYTDLRFTGTDTPTGVGKHIVQMTCLISGRSGYRVSLLGARDQVSSEGRVRGVNALGTFPATRMPLPWKLAEALWTGTGGPAVDRWCQGADWVYCPKNDLIPLRQTRVAVTFHGAPELDPELPCDRSMGSRANRWRRRTAYRRMVAQSEAVLTVSDFLKKQVIQWFGADQAKVHVIGNGVEEVFFQMAEAAKGVSGESLDHPFVLAVGGLNDLDGGDRILAVADHLQQAQPDLRVLVAGHHHERGLLEKVAAMSNVTLLGYVPSHRLACYMRDAVALLYPTRYETFGIAAAEAMAAGTPIVTCASTAVPEIVGDAALYFDPENPAEGASLILELLNDERTSNHLSAKGRARAAHYTWQKCADRLARVFEAA
jgi:glycosyltransferase involved in cell wall biosynthesis